MNHSIVKSEKAAALARYQKPSDFLRLAPGKAAMELMHVKDQQSLVVSVQNEETPSLVTLKKEAGVEKVIAYIQAWLVNINTSLNVRRPMTADQIIECSIYMLEDYYSATIADIKLFFSEVKKGKYGEFYESFSMTKVLMWFDDFWQNRCEAVYEANLRRDEEIHGTIPQRRFNDRKDSSMSRIKGGSIQTMKELINLKK